MADSINIMIVEDHDLMSFGIREFLETIPIVQVVATARNADEARIFREKQQIDLVIMDIRINSDLNGISLTSEFIKESPDLAILIYSMDCNVELVRQAVNAGARGYVPKGAGLENFKKAIEIIVAGGSYLPRLKTNPNPNPLTLREEEILKLIATRKKDNEICEMLEIVPSTMKSHRSHIMEKLYLENAVEVYQYAIEHYPQ
ncbi:response regulator transcription factor [Nitrosomonas sp. Nm132]|jgi:DNA-binding NarL/FixJ family response regulator|uniref:response regulator transcription factor n=1 Tax=Nitrosomonas sp. Nm132 TaxID=1881053 RepID=UPI00088F57E8|nr:response regulator transcription factor [Nitrosomonas sp. Nm132]SDI11659.1 two-component system, NarL family, invasion response regulator UvrY/two-component system, LuxR family, secretion system response regulator SsrB [Nitrosomonas sp. Nm132]